MKRRCGGLGQRYAAALDELEKAETKLVRAQSRWRKARDTVRRLNRELDRAQAHALGARD